MNMIPRMNSSLKRGFSLMELLVTISIIAIIAAIITPNFISSQKRAQDDNAVARAATLDLAKATFLQEQGVNAVDAWNVADALGENPSDPSSDRDQQKYALLRPYLNVPPSMLGYGKETGQFAPYGYRFRLGDLTGPTTAIRLSDGQNIGQGGASEATYTLTINRSPVSGGTVAGAGTYGQGTVARATAVSAMGYEFKEWTGDASGSDNTVALTMDSNKTVTAVFETVATESCQITVNTNNPDGGQVRIDGAWGRSATTTVGKGDMVTIQAQGINGYQFIGWTGVAGSSPSLSFTVEKSMNIMAAFKPPSYTMNISADTGGTASPSGTFTQPRGSSLRITAVATSGYEFDHWTVNGTNYGSSSYAANVTGNITARAYFKLIPKPKFDLTVQCGPGGNVTAMCYDPAQTVAVPAGGSGTLMDMEAGSTAYLGAVADENFNLLFWEKVSGDGSFSSPVASLDTTFDIGSSDASVRVNFLEEPKLNLNNIDDILVDVSVRTTNVLQQEGDAFFNGYPYSSYPYTNPLDGWVPGDWYDGSKYNRLLRVTRYGRIRSWHGWNLANQRMQLYYYYGVWCYAGYKRFWPSYQQASFLGTTNTWYFRGRCYNYRWVGGERGASSDGNFPSSYDLTLGSRSGLSSSIHNNNTIHTFKSGSYRAYYDFSGDLKDKYISGDFLNSTLRGVTRNINVYIMLGGFQTYDWTFTVLVPGFSI